MEIRHLEAVAAGGAIQTLTLTHTFTQSKPGGLILMNPGEVDSSGNGHPDQIIAYLVQDGGQGIAFVRDYSISNTSPWGGFIPLVQGFKVVIAFVNPPAGAVCSCDFLLGSVQEIARSGVSNQQSKAVYPLGGLRVISLDGTAAGLTLALQPQEGFTWDIIECWGFHDDTSARTIAWSWYDGITTITKGGTGAPVAAQVVTPLPVNGNATSNWLCSPARCHHGVYPILTADALTAGKKIYIRAVVAEYGGLQ